ncbi:MAG: UDP-glucose 4-epimerase GalE [Actinomycetota bacterium]
MSRIPDKTSAINSGTQAPVLVTGAAGYIGSHTVRALLAAGREVIAFDSLELGTANAVRGVPLIVGDVADGNLVKATIQKYGISQVVHFAAYKSVGESMRQPIKYWRNNVSGSTELIAACHSEDVTEFVFSSSCSVYGTPEAIPVDESATIAPESVYAESKATVERVLAWSAATLGIRSISLRYFNAAGASLDGDLGENWDHSINLIPLVMKALLLPGHAVDVFGSDYDTPDGTAVRDYIHVADLANAHVLALDCLAAGADTMALNLGTGTGSSVRQVIECAQRVANRPVPHRFVDRRPGDPVATIADPRRAERVLGWKARYALDTIIESAFDWHSARPPTTPAQS